MLRALSTGTIARSIAFLVTLTSAARAQEPPATEKKEEMSPEPPKGEEKTDEGKGDEGKGDESAVEKANNPLTAATGINLQNYFVPSLYGTSGTANQMLLRLVVPVKLGLQQVVRATLPLATMPSTSGGDSKSGLGDLNLFDVLLLTNEDAELQFGVGPQATFPTAAPSELGAGKWQIGAASVIIWMPAKAVLLGALVTWQASVASTSGGSSRPAQDQLLTQPIGIFQMGHGFYLRSTGSAIFNLHSGDYAVPFGIGAGKVLKLGKIVFNGFLEPQFTFLHHGVGQPAMQLFSGLNVQVF